MEAIARKAKPGWTPEVELPTNPRDFKTPNYGLMTYADLFTQRQIATLATFSDLVHEARDRAERDAKASGMSDDVRSLESGGAGAVAYADAIAVYVSFAVSKTVDRNTSLCFWETRMDRLRGTFGRQALPMIWDYAETNPFAGAGGDFYGTVRSLCEVLDQFVLAVPPGFANQLDACVQSLTQNRIVSCDPPYYDNIGYADLSDFFYLWLRHSLRSVFRELFGTLAVPKAEELVATPYRHGSKENAEAFFLKGMTHAIHRIAEQAHPGFPVTIYYAFKQSESENEEGVASTGWETFIDAVIRAGLAIDGTWPMRTEQLAGLKGRMNALASSIILVCRPRGGDIPTATRREFLTALKAELPDALKHLQRGNIAPVDLAQAAIGPGMGVYTRYSKVLNADGKPLSVRDALALINQTLDEVLSQQEGDFDADSRWAVAWFEQTGFDSGDFGVADVLARAKNTTVNAMKESGVVASKGGKVRLLKPSELYKNWNPAADVSVTAWEMVHHLIRTLDSDGEIATAKLVAMLGTRAEIARELAYRLYVICERKRRASEALSYNALVQSWPEIVRLSNDQPTPPSSQSQMFSQE
jgi:putative DNA methylase